jgi:hypothetical protein
MIAARASSWATKVMIGLIQMVSEYVEAGFLAFLLSRVVGVMKEDFWYRVPKSTVLRPSSIHWWEYDDELIKLARARRHHTYRSFADQEVNAGTTSRMNCSS